MKIVFNKLSTTLVIALMMFTSSFQVMADDTEIFFSSVSLSGTTNIQPNVLMVLDTSSSMTNQVGTTGMNRLEHMKEAMHTILDNSNNINVGIMRFHGKGGPVLFPVADINADVDTVLGTAPTTPQTFNRIENGTDDVEQAGTWVYSGTDELTLGIENFSTACGGGGNTSVSYRINDNADDVEEDEDGDVGAGSSDLELIRDGSTDQHVGLRFNGVAVPNGATIACAFIDFEIDVQHTADADLDIYVHHTNNASGFSAGNNTYDVTGRIGGGDPSVAWDNADGPAVNQILTTPDIGSLVQDIVNRGGWSSGNSMAFIINGSGKREVESHNGEASAAPLLRIEYNTGTPVPANQKIGLRFSDVKIPQGSTITGAYIDFTSINATNSDSMPANIYAEDVDNSAPFNTGLLTDDVANRIANKTANSPVNWNVPTWNPNTLYSTPDLKDIVQDIVDRTGWCGGNAMSFLLDASTGTRKAVSDDGDQGISPALRIEYDESTATGCNTHAIQAQIKTGNDDAEEDSSGIDFSSSDIELNEDGSTSQTVGLRFQDINVSSTDTIVSAELEFTVDDDDLDSDTINVTIYGEYAGDSQPFSSTNLISTRTKTTASVNWSPVPWTAAGDKHVTPDISPIIQEIVGHSGWSALNNMSFIIEGHHR